MGSVLRRKAKDMSDKKQRTVVSGETDARKWPGSFPSRISRRHGNTRRIPHPLHNYRASQDCLQKMAFGGDGSGGGSQGPVAFGGNNQGRIAVERWELAPKSCNALLAILFCLNPCVFNLNPPDAAVVGGVQGIGQAQDGS